jgi:hypothetical protein
MNPTRVIITVVDALLQHRRYVLMEAASLPLPAADGQAGPLNGHCVLEIDPPHVRIRRLDAEGRIVVNGELAADGAKLHDGDEVWVGDVLLTVCVELAQVPELAPAIC